jgi:hypothetical protein
MIRFFNNILVFVLLFGLLSLGLVFSYQNRLKDSILSKVKPSTHVVILGDSHFQNGIIDTFFNNYAINLSVSGETYFSAYQKLQFLYNQNKSFDKILVSLGPHNLDSKIDSLWVKSEENFVSSFGVYGLFFNLNHLFAYFKILGFGQYTAMSCFVEVVSQAIYSIERKILLNEFVYLGGFVPNTTVTAFKKINQEDTRVESIQISSIQSEYLGKIVKLAKMHGDTVYLINAPLFYGTKLSDDMRSLSNKNVVYLDFGDFFIRRNDLFADYVHLNPKGAELFTKRLKNDLNL